MSAKGNQETASSDNAAAKRPGHKETTRPAKPQKEEEAMRYNTKVDIRAGKTDKSGNKAKQQDRLRNGT